MRRWAQRLAVIGVSLLAAPAVSWSQSTRALIAPGDYWISPRGCLTHPMQNQNMNAEITPDPGPIMWCVYRMEIGRSRMTVHARREVKTPDHFQYWVNFGPYKGNRSMYLVDNNGERYDTIATTGAMRDGGKLWRLNPLDGTFVFPAPAPNARSFVFHDDDLQLRLEGLQPEMRNRIDAKRQASLRAVLKSADHLRFRDSSESGWGMTFSAEKQPGKKWIGEGVYVNISGPHPVPVHLNATVVATFLDAMAATLLIEHDPVRDVTQADRSFLMSVEIVAGTRSISFRAEGAGFYALSPWIVTIDGKSYLSTTPIPEVALTDFRGSLDISKYVRPPG